MQHQDARRVRFETCTRLSDLIAIALTDLEACEADPYYEIDMGHWHGTPPFRTTCHVCLAGAVMAKTVGVFLLASVEFAEFDWQSQAKFKALDLIRRGRVAAALAHLGEGLPLLRRRRISVTSYGSDPAAFKSDMRRIAATLAEAGL